MMADVKDAPLQSVGEFDVCPWLYFRNASPEERLEQQQVQTQLKERASAHLSEHCFVSSHAAVFTDSLSLGERSYIAAHAYLTGIIKIGSNSTVNPYAVVRGNVTLGNGVRVGAHTSILGFDHIHTDTNKPIYHQGTVSKGITIEDDVYIGSNAVILDGVTVASHSIIAAGAVVTKDVPEYAVMGGSPATFIKDRRRTKKGASSLEAKLNQFGEAVHSQLDELLAYYVGEVDGKATYLQQPGHEPTVRAWADAIEIAAMFDELPPLLSREAYIEKLQALQDPETGIIPDPYPHPETPMTVLGDRSADYLILSVGYALECLGSHLKYPLKTVQQQPVDDLYTQLASLPWTTRAWGAGAWIDAYGTAQHLNIKHFGNDAAALAPVMGWLLTHIDKGSGVWGTPTPQGDWLQPVNGFYRLTRGTYAQFGLPLPFPETSIDTILRHTRNRDYFREDRGNACNVLDIIHPLWLCGLQTDYRQQEIQGWATGQLERTLRKWVDGKGFSFNLEQGTDPRSQCSLQGTEMWLSIMYLLAEVIGNADALGYSPKGVHRLEPYPLLQI